MLVTSFSPFPEIETERLRLRKINTHDAPALFDIRSHERVLKYLDRPRPASQQEIIGLIEMISGTLEKNEAITWGISLKNELPLIGTIGFWRMIKEHYRSEIGYLLHPDYHRQGIMTEAMGAVLQYGFREMGLHSIEAHVNPENQGSIRLLENAGFVREAYFRENFHYQGRFLDTAVYSLVKVD